MKVITISNLSEIVKVNIDLNMPAVDSASFDHILIFGPLPVLPARKLPAVSVYTQLEDVTADGYITTGVNADPIGIAARIAFSQNPMPSQVFVAPIRANTPLISDAEIKIITASNALTDGIPVGTLGPAPDDLPWLQVAYSHKAVSSMEISVEKDSVVIWGKQLQTTNGKNSYVQVILGDGTTPEKDQMNIPLGNQAGVYNVTLTAQSAGVTTTINQSVTYDGTGSFTVSTPFTMTTPLMQSPVDALNAATETTGWYIACPAGIPESAYEEIAEWIEAHVKQFAYTFLTPVDPVGDIYYRSQGWCGLIDDDDEPDDVLSNQYLHIAAVAKILSYPAGSETWKFKQLAAVYPTNMSSTLRKALEDGHSNYFKEFAGRNITMNGQVRSGEWIDVIRGRDWLQNDMQLRLFNLLLLNPKIPYTNSGIGLAQNQMIASLGAAQARGIVAGTEFDDDGNKIPGFTTSVPNSASMTASQKASRVLTDCKFSARLAGAIHAIEVNGALTY